MFKEQPHLVEEKAPSTMSSNEEITQEKQPPVTVPTPQEVDLSSDDEEESKPATLPQKGPYPKWVKQLFDGKAPPAITEEPAVLKFADQRG